MQVVEQDQVNHLLQDLEVQVVVVMLAPEHQIPQGLLPLGEEAVVQKMAVLV
jgi:hypothetical protein